MDETITKTVQVIGLGSTEHESERHFADEITDEHDLFTMAETNKDEYLFYDGDDVVNIDRRLYQKLNDQDLGHYTDKETYTKEELKWSTSKPVKWEIKRLVQDVFLDHPELEKGFLGSVDRVDTGESIINPRSSITTTKIPKVLQEQEPDDLFVEDSEERPAVVFRVSLRDCPAKFATAANHVLPEMLAEKLLSYEPVERVRFVNCFETNKTEYTCPRI